LIVTTVRENVVEETSATELTSFAISCLFECLGVSRVALLHPSKNLFLCAPLNRVNVTIRTRGKLRGSMSSGGDSLGAQIQGAVRNAANDKRFKSRLSAIEVNSANLEIWLQTDTEQVTFEEIKAGHFLELGVDGVEIHFENKSAYYKPSVAITSGKYDIEALMTALCRKAGMSSDVWKDPKAIVLRTKWISIADSPQGIISPHQPAEIDIDSTDVIRWMRESAQYLVNSRQASGDFTYIYDPIEDLEVIEPPSRVRSAGCLYALSCFLDSEYSDEMGSGFGSGLQTLAAAQVDRTVKRPAGGRVMPEPKNNDHPKLGSTALLTLALGGRRLSGQFGVVYEDLFASVVMSQLPSGRFLTHFGAEVENVRSSEFFSGQALLTFVQRAEQGDADALEKCAAAFEAYRHQFLTNPTSAFVGWHVDVWSRLALLTKRTDYAEFAFEQIDWLLQMQVTDAPESSWIGGFRNGDKMPKYSSIVFLEAVVRAYILASSVGLQDKVLRYRRAIQLGLRFCSRLRLGEHQMSWFPNPERSRGGIALSILDRRVRCDIPQHFITLCLVLLRTDGIFPTCKNPTP
jgi:AMMECR1 domain-containing protein